jgi:predicted enzyme related to lactoylglutathione lyase
MPNARFARYVLRTADAPAAQAFYQDVLGHQADHIYPLHEQALARGARPHWLGHIDVADPAAAAAPFLAAGGLQYGERPDGVVVLRDPGGAILALGGVNGPSRAGVQLHVLRAPNAENLAARYVELFGWSLGERLVLAKGETYRRFAFAPGEPSAGVVGDVTAGVHPQWLFFFAVPSLENALAKVRAHGGVAIEPSELPDGRQVAACDDPQGAAFGLVYSPSSSSAPK